MLSFDYLDLIIYGIVFIFLANGVIYLAKAFERNTIEGMDNSDNSQDNIAILAYKNAGAIENIQKKQQELSADIKTVYQNEAAIQQISKQVSNLVQQAKLAESTNDEQNTEIKTLQTNQDKLKTVAVQADDLSQDNKQRLLSLSRQAHQKGKMVASAASKLKSP
jgi:uncharacterized protein (DUF3084 family)